MTNIISDEEMKMLKAFKKLNKEKNNVLNFIDNETKCIQCPYIGTDSCCGINYINDCKFSKY